MKAPVFFMVFVMAAITAEGVAASETISFPSGDGIAITADLYMAHDTKAPFVILCHQSDFSRAEYADIAPRLNELGFNAMAIDQRSGMSYAGTSNQTATRARAAKKGTDCIDALPDIIAAVAFAKKNYAQGKLILWGSSYSASLALKIAGDDPSSCDAVLAFSPAEYFSPPNLIGESAKKITVPVFITSASDERGSWQPLYDKIPSKGKVFFIPGSGGKHGSISLLGSWGNADEYWRAVEAFLKNLK